MSWQAVREAFILAVVNASGLDDQHVFWANQNPNQPPPKETYVDLTITSSGNPGQDGLVSTTDLTRPRGQEIKQQVTGIREVVLQFECWTASTVTDVDNGSDALAVLERIRSSFVFPDVRYQLGLAGVSLVDIEGEITYAPTIISVGFKGRGTWDIRCFVPAEALAQYIGYIESVSGTATIEGAGTEIVEAYTAP